MKKLLAQLLQNNYTKKDILDQLRLITTDIKADSHRPPEGKAFPDLPHLITSDTTAIGSLVAAVEKLPLATITLAISLPKEEIPQLGQWFRREVDPQVLLEIKKDPQIIGGCQIIWQGFEGDFSLRRKFEKVIN